MIGAEIVIRLVVAKDMEDGNEQTVGDGDDGTFLPAPCGRPPTPLA